MPITYNQYLAVETVLSFLLPPLAVAVHTGVSLDLAISVVLWLFLWFPGIIYSLYVVFTKPPSNAQYRDAFYLSGFAKRSQKYQTAYSQPVVQETQHIPSSTGTYAPANNYGSTGTTAYQTTSYQTAASTTAPVSLSKMAPPTNTAPVGSAAY